MTVEAAAPGDAAAARQEPEGKPPAGQPVERRVAAAALALLPGGLILFFGFNGGGYFPGSPGFVGLVVASMIVVRVLVADEPFAGFSRQLAVASGLFAAFTGWVLASGLWSDSEARTLIEFDRALLYLLLLVLLGLLPRRAERVKWIVRGCALAAFLVCTAGLITRVLPDVWPISPGVAENRLSFPLTYWNALGIVATIGMLLGLGLTTSDRERRWTRSLAAAAVPVFAVTLLFTFSRGAMIAGLVGLLALVVISRQRALLGGLLAAVPPTVVAVVVAYGADELATKHPATARGVAQGEDVALAVGLAVLVAGALRFALELLDRRVARVRYGESERRRLRIGVAAAAALAVVVFLAAGGPGYVSDQFDRFLEGSATAEGDLRDRLTDPSSNGRTDHWNAAFAGFSDAPLHGTGAGSYEFLWERERDIPLDVADAHGLYFEVIGELGIVGLLLLLATIVAILTAFARRASGLNRGYYAALFAAGLAWALHAGIDWDWEMPATTAWLFAAGGAALAARAPTGPPERPPAQLANGNRIAIAAAFLVLAVTPALLMLSQPRLSEAAKAFESGDCDKATDAALRSIDYVAVRPQPYQLLGYCNLAQGRLTQAVAAMEKAVEQEPDNWEYHYSLAVARAVAGRDPRAELATAGRLNPRELLVDDANRELRDAGAAGPDAWQKAGQKMWAQALDSGNLTFR